MWEIVITSSVLILAIIAVRFLLKGELSQRVGYALWLLAAARLLVPVSFGLSSFSVLNLVPQVELPDRGSIYISSQGITATQPPPQEGWEAGPSDSGADGTYAPAGDRYQVYYPPKSEAAVFNPVGETPPEDYTTVPASHILPTPKPVLTAVWFMGMAVVGVWFVWVNRSFRKRLREGARPLEVPDCPLKVYVVEDIPSPCLAGLLRPAIYVTPACAEDEARLRHVLAHELTHWRHKDPLWSLVRCVCLTVYWFHPLVWLAGFLSRRDCELACDEGTLERLGEEERLAYGRTLIGLIEVSSSPAHLLQTATTMVDRKKGVKERLLFIAQKPRVVAAAGVFAVLIAAVAAACAFTGAAEPDRLTVEEALADIPAELTAPEESFESIAVYTPENSAELFALEEGELLRGYWRTNMGLSSSAERPLGWLASLYRMDQAAYDALAEGRSDAGQTDARWECFARDRDFYYLIHAPMTVPIIKVQLAAGANIPANGPELQERLVEWLKAAVLSADGVVAFEGAEFNTTEALAQEELDWFNTAFFNGVDANGREAERMMNNMILRRTWLRPEDIDLFGLFYNGLGTPGGDRSQLTGEELAQLEAACGGPVELDVFKITSAEMDAFLREKLGIGLEETRKVGLDSFIYLPDFDAYYNVAGDTNYEPCTVTGGWKQRDGTLTLNYEMAGEERSAGLRETGEGDYIFLWNLNLVRG